MPITMPASSLIQDIQYVLLDAFIIKSCWLKGAFSRQHLNQCFKFILCFLVIPEYRNVVPWPLACGCICNSFSSERKKEPPCNRLVTFNFKISVSKTWAIDSVCGLSASVSLSQCLLRQTESENTHFAL